MLQWKELYMGILLEVGGGGGGLDDLSTPYSADILNLLIVFNYTNDKPSTILHVQRWLR